MALDITVGGPASDSYCTVLEADTYHTTRAANPEWAAADVPTKETHLKWAARQLDLMFRFHGRKATKEQARQWPRNGAVDRDGFSLDDVPAIVKDAQAEYALQLMREDWTQGLGSIRDQGATVGPLKTTPERHVQIPASVIALLRGVAVTSSGGGFSFVTAVRG